MGRHRSSLGSQGRMGGRLEESLDAKVMGECWKMMWYEVSEGAKCET